MRGFHAAECATLDAAIADVRGDPAKDLMTTEQTAPAEPIPTPRQPAETPRRRRGWLCFLRDVLVIVLIAVLVSFLVKTFVVRSFCIPSGSMEDTLLINDRILVDEITPHFGGYHRGDIVVFQRPGRVASAARRPRRTRRSSRRVDWALSLRRARRRRTATTISSSASSGCRATMWCAATRIGQITVNGVPIDESSYLKLPTGETRASGDPFDIVVPADRLWVLGDNRYRSKDSRYNQDEPGKGFVPIDERRRAGLRHHLAVRPLRPARLPPRGVRGRSRHRRKSDSAQARRRRSDRRRAADDPRAPAAARAAARHRVRRGRARSARRTGRGRCVPS